MSHPRSDVIFHLGKTDEALPESFTWRGARLAVIDVGRRWDALDGEHILVMVTGNIVYELIHHTVEGWFVIPPPNLHSAV